MIQRSAYATTIVLLAGLAWSAGLAKSEVGPVPSPVRERYALDVFYQKHVAAGALAVVSSARVSDAALLEAAWIVGHMVAGRDEVLRAMASNGCLVAVMACGEYTTDLPQQRELRPKAYWDKRARGLGGALVSCGEENLLAFPGDPYPEESILIHEFAHAVLQLGLSQVDATFDVRLKAAYAQALERGLWKGTYSAENPGEYWAAGSQDWFGRKRENDAATNHVNTREELKTYDPALAALCREVYGDRAWRYRPPAERGPEGRAHLAGYDPVQAPRFRWREEARDE